MNTQGSSVVPSSRDTQIVSEELECKVYVYTGGDWDFRQNDGPAKILTHLQSHDFNHIETTLETVDLIIIKDRSVNRLRFRADALDSFQIKLLDDSTLDTDSLDEHILLTN